MFENKTTMKYSKIKFLTFFAIICSIGLAPINDASANEGTAITKVESKEHDTSTWIVQLSSSSGF